MRHIDFTQIGRPAGDHGRARARAAAALLAATAGAAGLLIATFSVVGGTSPAEGPATWAIALVLLAVCVTGLWWRWDSPDARDPHHERERRGF